MSDKDAAKSSVLSFLNSKGRYRRSPPQGYNIVLRFRVIEYVVHTGSVARAHIEPTSL